jgi:hypothetical protein
MSKDEVSMLVEDYLDGVKKGSMAKVKYYHMIEGYEIMYAHNKAFKLAVQHNQLEILEYLVEKQNYKFKEFLKNKKTFLITICTTNKYIEILKYLHKNKFINNWDYMTIIKVAAGCGYLELLKYFCEEVNIIWRDSFSSLSLAIENTIKCDYFHVLKYFIETFVPKINSDRFIIQENDLVNYHLLSIAVNNLHIAKYFRDLGTKCNLRKILLRCADVTDFTQLDYIRTACSDEQLSQNDKIEIWKNFGGNRINPAYIRLLMDFDVNIENDYPEHLHLINRSIGTKQLYSGSLNYSGATTNFYLYSCLTKRRQCIYMSLECVYPGVTSIYKKHAQAQVQKKDFIEKNNFWKKILNPKSMHVQLIFI